MEERSIFFNILEWLYLKQTNNLVYYDELTGVKNRNYYESVILKKYAKKECIVIMCDINNMKIINDTHGHLAGDKALKMLANKLSNIPGVNEVCRMGGDEFLIIGKSINLSKFNSIIEASFGYYYKNKSNDLAYSIHIADDMMYRIKKEQKKKNTR